MAHFGINPSRGGRPPKDIKSSIILMAVAVGKLNKDVVFRIFLFLFINLDISVAVIIIYMNK